MKPYLLVFDAKDLARQDIINTIDNINEIANWYAFMPNTICLVSESSAKSLARVIRSNLPSIHFIVTQIDPDTKGGWLRKSVWDFINRPQAVKTSVD